MAGERFKRRVAHSPLDKFADSISLWVGSWSFFNIHVMWFGVWLIVRWDINLLTLMVSLEAIILMIFLLMQQNRQVARDDARDEADFRIDKKTKELAQQNNNVLAELMKNTEHLEKLLKKHDKNSN